MLIYTCTYVYLDTYNYTHKYVHATFLQYIYIYVNTHFSPKNSYFLPKAFSYIHYFPTKKKKMENKKFLCP